MPCAMCVCLALCLYALYCICVPCAMACIPCNLIVCLMVWLYALCCFVLFCVVLPKGQNAALSGLHVTHCCNYFYKYFFLTVNTLLQYAIFSVCCRFVGYYRKFLMFAHQVSAVQSKVRIQKLSVKSATR